MLQSVTITKVIIGLVAAGTAISLIVLALSITTLIKVNNSNRVGERPTSHILTTTMTPIMTTTMTTANPNLISSIRIESVMDHMRELQKIANDANNNRAVNTLGFNRTLDYITNELRSETDFLTFDNSLSTVIQY
jgi:hypothetical protein